MLGVRVVALLWVVGCVFGSQQTTVLPLIWDQEPSVAVTVNGATVYLNIDTGSSNLALPAAGCKACWSKDTFSGPSAACKAGTFDRSCDCPSGVNLHALSLQTFAQPCGDRGTNFDCDGLPFEKPCGYYPHSLEPFSLCKCHNASSVPMLAGTEAARVGLDVALSGGCYGDNQGYSGVVLDAKVKLGTLETRTYATAFSLMTSDFKCGARPAQGIMGLAYQRLSSLNTPTPIGALAASGVMANVFTLCMKLPHDVSQGMLTPGAAGAMYLGSYGGTAATVSKYLYTPIVAEMYYGVHVLDVSLEGNSVSTLPGAPSVASTNQLLNGGSAIVDSGTEQLVFPKPIGDAIKTYLGIAENQNEVPSTDGLPPLVITLGVEACYTLEVPTFLAATFCGGGGVYTAATAIGVTQVMAVSLQVMAAFSFVTRAPGQPQVTQGYVVVDGGVNQCATHSATTPICEDSVVAFAFSGSALEAVPEQGWFHIYKGQVAAAQAKFERAALPPSAAPVTMSIQPKYYLPPYNNQRAVFLGAQPTSAMILGMPAFWGHSITFDRRNKRVGFALQGSCKPTLSPVAPGGTTGGSGTGGGGSSLSGGVVAGIVVGVLVACVLVATVIKASVTGGGAKKRTGNGGVDYIAMGTSA
eukprot:m.109133 g.109133  ORF g.109133 m.109133 type:complete len:639 (+) comp15956_c0_seq1:140-2056(+)